jgi:hypothetical protein
VTRFVTYSALVALDVADLEAVSRKHPRHIGCDGQPSKPRSSAVADRAWNRRGSATMSLWPVVEEETCAPRCDTLLCHSSVLLLPTHGTPTHKMRLPYVSRNIYRENLS